MVPAFHGCLVVEQSGYGTVDELRSVICMCGVVLAACRSRKVYNLSMRRTQQVSQSRIPTSIYKHWGHRHSIRGGSNMESLGALRSCQDG